MFVENYATIFTEKLASFSPPNVGVVSPRAINGNNQILTHDFVHRTHLDIFPTYYPVVFGDWFMDDWISHVYGNDHTCELASVTTKHTLIHGQRYESDMRVSCFVEYELMLGERRIADWLFDNRDKYVWPPSFWYDIATDIHMGNNPE